MKIYLDNSATTEICDEALAKYIEVSRTSFGNPSSLHALGMEAEKIMSTARSEILKALQDRQSSVVFTSSGTEANNLAIIGRAMAKERYKKGSRIITTDSEHASVNAPLETLARMGFEVVKIPTRGGAIDFDALSEAMTKNVILVTMMLVNNETGAIYDLARVSRLMKVHCPEAILHADATQAYLKFPFTKKSIGADMITVSSHKIEGPKGVGALIIDGAVIKNKGISPIVFGGGQEMGLRSGTENVPAIAAFGEAARVGSISLSENFEKLNSLRALLCEKLQGDDTLSVSPTLPERFAPHILNVTLPGIKSETMLHYLSSEGIYVSSGSACSSNSAHKESALVAFGRTPEEADYSIRISFSHRNTEEDVLALTSALGAGIKKLARARR